MSEEGKMTGAIIKITATKAQSPLVSIFQKQCPKFSLLFCPFIKGILNIRIMKINIIVLLIYQHKAY